MKQTNLSDRSDQSHRSDRSRWTASVLPALFGLLLFALPAAAQTNSQQIYLACLTNFESYAETIWTTSATVPDAGYWGDGGSTGNGGIRGNSGIAVAYAVLCLAQPNDPKFTSRLARVRQALNYDYNTHVTGGYNTTSGTRWGWSNTSSTDWQTPEWAASMGLACVLVQSNLPAATVAGVRIVVASEADHRAAIAPASGYIGDTKAEENAWQGNILALAAAWMSASNNAPAWLAAAKSYLVNTYTVPNTNGDPLASWVTTQTLYPSFALQNHGFYHPTYEMVAGMSSGDSLLMARLANASVAAELQVYAEHNVMAVWTNNLSTLVTDTGDFAYPAGVDWAVRDFEHNSFITWMATHFNDPLARWADDRLSKCVRYRQLAYGDGRFVGPSGGGFYREAVEARRTAIAWLHLNFADHPAGTMTAPSATLMHNTDVQVIHQRSQFGTFSISYNSSRIMACVEPSALSVPTNAFISSPRLPGILGLGALGNPSAAMLVSYSTNAAGFEAEIKLTSSLGTTETYIKSTGESFAIIEVPRLNSGSTASSGGSFICGIENDPLTGGTRLIEWGGANSATITNRSGAARNITNHWLCVSGRYGLAAGPAGYFRYAATNGYARTSPSYSEAGEAEDALSFVENNPLAPRYAVWFPAKTTLQTSNAAAAITWVTNSATATLTFPGAGGAATTLSAYIGASTNNSGAWNVDADGNWSNANNWSGGIVADGAGYTANFSAVNIAADRTVTLDSSRGIGALKFGDLSGAQNWVLTHASGSILTLNNGSTSPAIAVTNAATLALPLAGANGFTKSGPGTLVLSGTNSLSGTLYLDSTSTSANDGAVRITRSASVAGAATPIYLKNNNGGSSTLQLDGSQGDLRIAQGISLAGRNAGVVAIQNVAGSNTIAGDFILTSGGGIYWFDSDAGTLSLSGSIPASAPTVPSARTLTFMGAGNFAISGVIANANGYAVSLVKSNSGALMLNGVNTYTGSTTVSGGTLGGSGVIAGPVTVQAAGTLAPGSSIGRLTVNSDVTLAGTTIMEVTHAGPTNDVLAVSGTLRRGGSLIVTNAGSALAGGDSFKLFEAGVLANSFGGITLPALAGGLRWNTNQLDAAGIVAVEAAQSPQLVVTLLSGTILYFQFNTETGFDYVLQSATNLEPNTVWSEVLTNAGTGGVIGFPIPVGAQPRQFFRIKVQ